MIEKLYPKTMRPVLDSMDVGWKAHNDAAHRVGQKAKRLRRLVLFLHKKPIWAQLAHFALWATICGIVAIAIRYCAADSPAWGLVAAILLQLLYFLSMGWLAQLQPKSPISLKERWKISSRAFALKYRRDSAAIERALRYAREDLAIHDTMTGLVLHTLIIGALVNASIDNDFIDALGKISVQCAWKQSYIGTTSILLIPFAFFARVLFYSGPVNWIRLIERSLPE